ncbi:MAG: ATP-binding protein [Actinomycetota bacterium]
MSSSSTVADLQVERLERRLARERERAAVLEQMIEDKTRSLYLAHEEISLAKRFQESVLRCMDSAVIVTDQDGVITSVSGTTAELVSQSSEALIGTLIFDVLIPVETGTGETELDRLINSDGEADLHADDGSLTVLLSTSALTDERGNRVGAVCVANDISDRKRLETELNRAHKLESVGQLAAGVAHEINTPIQFIGDSVHFLGDVLRDVFVVLEHYDSLRKHAQPTAASDEHLSELLATIAKAEQDADLEFAQEMAPSALRRTLEGVDRVSTIVQAMKRFSHPGRAVHELEDLNEILDTTLAVSLNEYRYSADVIFNRGEIPEVQCNRSDLSQAFLNILVNAAHAIEDHIEPGGRGTIEIETRLAEDGVLVTITDSGGGIPPDVLERIWDPFFTTKEPGRGTGQGLPLCHSLIVDGHGGRLHVEVEAGVGSTFSVWLPEDQS